MSDQELVQQIDYVNPAIVAKVEEVRARIQAMYYMAFKKPRDEDQARVKILDACRRPKFAEKVFYHKPISGRKPITGPSIRFAELALRSWGNVLTDTQILHEDDEAIHIKVYVTDLETNASHASEFHIKKTVERKSLKSGQVPISERVNSYEETVYLVEATEDEMLNKVAARRSKGMRNDGLRLIPSDIIEEALEIAEGTLKTQDAQDPDAAKKKIIDAFNGIGIKPMHLKKYLKHDLETLSPSELTQLRGMYQAIKDGEATFQSYLEGGDTGDDPKNEEPVIKNADQPLTEEQIEQLKYRAGGNDKILMELKRNFKVDSLGAFKQQDFSDALDYIEAQKETQAANAQTEM